MKRAWVAAWLVLAFAGCQAFRDVVTAPEERAAEEAQTAAADEARDVPAAYTNGVAPARVVLKDFSLRDYVAFAITNRPSLEVSRLAVSNAVLELAQVTSDRALQLGLSGGFSQSTANGSHFSWHQRPGQASATFTVDYLLYDFGRLDAREQQARENLIAAERELADAEFQVFDEVAQAYFALRRDDALLAVAHTNEFQYAEHLRQAEILLKAGETKKLDVLKARVDLSDAHLETINCSNAVLTTGAAFIRVLGLQADRTSRAEVMPVAPDALAAATRVLEPTSFSAETALALARTNTPALLTLRARLRAASAEVDYRLADRLPAISLSSAFAFTDPAWNFSWGVQAVQYLLDGERRANAVRIALVALESARLAVREAEQQLSHDLSVAVSTRDNTRTALETARVEVEQARENLENVVLQYRVGDASRLDFTDAASALATALGVRVKAFYAAEMAEAKLIRLVGRVPEKSR